MQQENLNSLHPFPNERKSAQLAAEDIFMTEYGSSGPRVLYRLVDLIAMMQRLPGQMRRSLSKLRQRLPPDGAQRQDAT